MTDEYPDSRFHLSPVILFDDTGHLGLATNGAAPDPVLGFQIEGEICHRDGEITHSYWLRPVTEVFQDGKVAQTQNFLFSTNPQRFERLLSTMCDAALRGGPTRLLPGHYDGWRNWSQNDFDESLDEDCIGDLKAHVGRATSGQLEVSLTKEMERPGPGDAGRGEAIARMDGRLSGPNADLLAFEARRFGAWRKDAAAVLEERAEDHKAAQAPTP